jgi:hypothetical protein
MKHTLGKGSDSPFPDRQREQLKGSRITREESFRRRRSLAFLISLKSATGRISFVPNFMPGCCEIS